MEYYFAAVSVRSSSFMAGMPRPFVLRGYRLPEVSIQFCSPEEANILY
jgi:hypothetical protein